MIYAVWLYIVSWPATSYLKPGIWIFLSIFMWCYFFTYSCMFCCLLLSLEFRKIMISTRVVMIIRLYWWYAWVLINSLIELTDWLIERFIILLIDWLISWLNILIRLNNWQVDWQVDCQAHELTDCQRNPSWYFFQGFYWKSSLLVRIVRLWDVMITIKSTMGSREGGNFKQKNWNMRSFLLKIMRLPGLQYSWWRSSPLEIICY